MFYFYILDLVFLLFKKNKFVKRFCEIVYHLLYSSMAEDHRVLFSFYLSMMYARGTN